MLMKVDLNTGRLEDALWQPSPNCDDRPTGIEPELIVVHNISLPPGEFGGTYIDDLFMNRLDPHKHPYFAQIYTLRVSAHLLIRRDGALTQFVSFDKRAWHAGKSCYQGRRRCNDFSVGIELEGTDELEYEIIQYRRLAQSIQALLVAFPSISSEAIVGHERIAPGRKTDPGTSFDWDLLHQLLQS